MNAIVQKMTSPVEDFIAEVLDPPRMAEIVRELPAHIKPALFQRNLFHAVMANPDLMNFSPGLVFREVSKAVSLGLLLDPMLGEAYIVVAYNYKSKSKEPQLRPGYRGLMKLARQSGEIKMIYAHEVCQNDVIDCELGIDKRLVHKPVVFGDRGKIIGYYAVVKLANGDSDFEPMSVEQIHTIRDRTDAWKAFSTGAIKSTPWATDESEMAKKTAIRRLLKRTSQSPELAEAIRLDDANEYQGAARAVPAPPTPMRISAPSPSAAPQPQQRAAPRLPPAPPPAPPKAATSPSQPAQEPSSPGVFDFNSFRADLQKAATLDEANAEFDRWIVPLEKHMSADEIDEAQNIMREVCQRFDQTEE